MLGVPTFIEKEVDLIIRSMRCQDGINTIKAIRRYRDANGLNKEAYEVMKRKYPEFPKDAFKKLGTKELIDMLNSFKQELKQERKKRFKQNYYR